MRDILQEILELPELTIERAEVQEMEIHLYVKLWTESAICPQCHPKECRELHHSMSSSGFDVGKPDNDRITRSKFLLLKGSTTKLSS